MFYRLKNNLYKNFNVEFLNDNYDTDMRCSINYQGIIDPNFTQAIFTLNGNMISLLIFDKYTNVYEKLILKYFGISTTEFKQRIGDNRGGIFSTS